MGIFRRGRWWYLRRRVPVRFAALDLRRPVVVALKTDSETEARARAADVERELAAYWVALEAGQGGDAAARHAAAVALATRRGVVYRTADDLAAGPVVELARRLLRLARAGELGDAALVEAELGGALPPVMPLSAAFDVFMAETSDRRAGMSDHQARKWTAPRRRAVATFIKLAGDKPLDAITRDDALTLRTWWRARVEAGETQPVAANKDFMHLGDVFRTVCELRALRLENPFDKLRLRDPGAAQRPSFSTEFLRATMLKPGALDGLNAEAADVLLIMVNTGAGLAEVCGARPADLATAADVPHLIIEAHAGRKLKTGHRGRAVPLLGVSLTAARRRAEAGGFPRYGGSPDVLSATVNKFLRENGMKPTPKHTAYSLRHSFQDRLIAAEVPERLQAHLMGHKLARPRYGAGPTLKHLAEWLAKVAL